jgi:hypothetical protein
MKTCILLKTRTLARCTLGLLLSSLVSVAAAQALPDDPLQRRCWLQYTADRTSVPMTDPMSVSFTNLREGFTVRSPFWVELGVRGMGLIPASDDHASAGHPILLVDTPLPILFSQPLPITDSIRHFGTGETGTLVDLPPGEHRLRLLIADHHHRPFFVYSPEIRVNVTGKRTNAAPTIDRNKFAATCKAWYQDEVTTVRKASKQVYVKNFRDGEPLVSPFVVSFGVTGYGVAPANHHMKDAGHFVLSVSRNKVPVQRIALANGRTEARLDLPVGDYTLEYSLVSGDGGVLLRGQPLHIPVVSVNAEKFLAIEGPSAKSP